MTMHNDPNSGIHSSSSEDYCLNALDINCTGDRVAVGGNSCKVHIYDDKSERKDFLMTLKAGGQSLPGHSKRIFAIKFDKT
jgi:hypothetical protein